MKIDRQRASRQAHYKIRTNLDENYLTGIKRIMLRSAYIAHCTKAIVKVTLKCIYLFFIIEIFQHNTHRLIYFEGLET